MEVLILHSLGVLFMGGAGEVEGRNKSWFFLFYTLLHIPLPNTMHLIDCEQSFLFD